MTPEEQTQEGRDFIKFLADYSNCMGRTEQTLVTAMVDAMHHQHKTIQQNMIRYLVTLLVTYSKTQSIDLRNEASVALCKKISELDTFLPFI